MIHFDIEAIRAQIRAMDFQRGTPEQLISQPGICADFVGGRRKAEGWKI